MTHQTLSKKHLRFFTFTTSMLWFSLYAYVAELSTYADTLGANFRMIGFITGAYGLTQLILRIPLGIVSDLIGKRKPFISIGLGVALISAMVTFLWPSPLSLFATRALAGVSAATWVLFTVMFATYYPKEDAPKAIGIINAYNAVGQLSAMLIGGFVSYLFGTRYLYLLAAIGAFVGFTVSLFLHEGVAQKKKASFKAFFLVLSNKDLLVVSVLAILSQLMTFATVFGFVPILAKNLGAKPWELSLLAILAIVPAIFMSPIASSLLPKLIGKKKTITIGFALSALLCIALPNIQQLWLLYLAQFFGGIGRSMVFPLLMGLGIVHVAYDKRATAMGMFQAVYGIGMVAGPILLGFIAESYGLTIGFLVTGLIGLLGIVLTLYRVPA